MTESQDGNAGESEKQAELVQVQALMLSTWQWQRRVEKKEGGIRLWMHALIPKKVLFVVHRLLSLPEGGRQVGSAACSWL